VLQYLSSADAINTPLTTAGVRQTQIMTLLSRWHHVLSG